MPGRSAADIWLEVSCLINVGQRSHSPVSGVTMDLLKAFNTLPRMVGRALYSALGLEGFSFGYHQLLESFERTFKVGRSIWPYTFSTSTGYLEGDPLAPVAMLLFTWAWGAQVQHVSRPLSYLDNWSLLFVVLDSIDFSVQKLDRDLKEALSATTDFCDMCDLSISVKPSKTWMWSTDNAVRQLFRQGDFRLQTKPIPLSHTERDLGAHLVYTTAFNSRTTTARYAEATKTCHRLRVMPLPYALKVLAVKVKVFPQAHYAGEVSRPPLRTIETLRSAVTSAVWAHERLFRSKEAVLNILRQVDPLREVYARPLFALRKLLGAAGIPDLWNQVYQEFLSSTVNTGFLTRVVESLRIFGWSPSPDAVVVRSIGRPFAFLEVPFQRFSQVIDEDWIRYISSSLSARSHAEELRTSRLDVDRMQRLLRVFPEDLRSDLEAVLGASHRWQVGQLPAVARNGRDDHSCPLCGAPSEGPQHVWMSCKHPAIAAVREQHLRAWRMLASAPPAFQAYGWLQVPRCLDLRSADRDCSADAELQRLKQRVQNFQFSPDRCSAYTDGSAKPPSIPALRTASCAVVLVHEDSIVRQVAFPLIGPIQTINRAELRSALEAVLLSSIEVCSDSSYVVGNWTPSGALPAMIPNGDLLGLLWHLTSAHHVPVRKVKAHCGSEVQPARDTRFNNAADMAAKAANVRRFAQSAFFEAMKNSKVLCMWTFISSARRAYLQALPAKSLQDDQEQETSEILSPFESIVLQGGRAYPLPVPDKRSFTTTGNTALLQAEGGSFAVHLCKFWALVMWHESHVARHGTFTSWLELMLAFEMLTGRPVPVQKGSAYVWPEDGWLQEVPAHNRVAIFRAGYNHLSKVFQVQLCPASAQVPVSFYGCRVQRQPIPGFEVRAEYPHRQEVCRFLQSTLCSLRSKTTFMHQVLQPPRAAAAWDLKDPTPSAGLVSSYKPQWGWLQNSDGSRTWRRLPPGHDAMVSFRKASEFGKFAPVQLFAATKAQRELFEKLWSEGTVTKGVKLVPVPADLKEHHLSRLTRVFLECNQNSEANGCHSMAVVTTSVSDKPRYHCVHCSLSRDETFFRRAWRERCPFYQLVSDDGAS